MNLTTHRTEKNAEIYEVKSNESELTSRSTSLTFTAGLCADLKETPGFYVNFVAASN